MCRFGDLNDKLHVPFSIKTFLIEEKGIISGLKIKSS